MVIFDANGYLGTSWVNLIIFILSGAVIAGITLLYFWRKEGIDSLVFQLVFRALWLFAPIAWIGLSIGSNLKNVDILKGGAQSNDAILNIALTFAISFVLIIFVSGRFTQVLRNYISSLNDVALTVAQGNLKNPAQFIRTDSNDIFSPFYRSFTKMLEELRSLIQDVLRASERVAGNSEEIAASSEQISASSGSISSIMENISQGSQKQVQKVLDATEAEKDLQNTINESFERIFESIQLVQEISEETNLLALNAAIEAQRAGEAGRGFSIVARNVRRLSDDTRNYSDEIVNLLYDVEAKIKNSQTSISDTIVDIRNVSEEVAASSEEVSASAEEQAATLEEMSAATQELANLAVELEQTLKRFVID